MFMMGFTLHIDVYVHASYMVCLLLSMEWRRLVINHALPSSFFYGDLRNRDRG